MAVVGIAVEAPDSPKGSFAKGKHSFDRKFLVETNSYNDGPDVVRTASGIPVEGDSYVFGNESSRHSRVTNVSADRKEPNSKWWVVSCSYETLEKPKTEDQSDDPTVELPEIKLSFEDYEVPITGTTSDTVSTGEFEDGIRNTAGDVYDPPYMRRKSTQVISITRNEPINAAHPDIGLKYRDTTNASEWFRFAAGCVRFMGVEVSRAIKTTKNKEYIPYLKTSYTFHARDTWDLEIPDMGPNYLKSIGGGGLKKMAFKDASGHPYVGLLNGGGAALCSDVLAQCSTPAVIRKFQVYRREDFGALNLPQGFTDFGGLEVGS